MSPERWRRLTGVLATLMILAAAAPLCAQDADSLLDDPLFPLELAPLTFQQTIADTRLSAGVRFDYVFEGRTQVSLVKNTASPLFGELTYEDGARSSAFIQYQLVPSAYAFVSVGYREEDLVSDLKEDSEPFSPRSEITLGELKETSVMAGFKFTSTNPFFGTGRTWKEVSLWPYGSLSVGVRDYDFDEKTPPFGPSEHLHFKPSFAGEMTIGLDLRIPPILSVGVMFGYHWSSPEVHIHNHITRFNEHDHLNISAMVAGVQAELRF